MTDHRQVPSRRAWIAALDAALLVAYIALQQPSGATGFVVHEWVGLGFIPVFVLHLVLSRRWIVTTWRRLRDHATTRARVNFVLNTSLFIMMSVVIVSGILVSDYAVPVLGLVGPRTRRWEQLHNFTSSLVTPVMALHLALNWGWITQTARRFLRRSVGQRAEAPERAK